MSTIFDFGIERTLNLLSATTVVAEAGAGPPVVLLHGNPDSHTMWAPVVARLSGSHRCIAPDLPGFGKSRPKAHPQELASYARFVLELLDALSLDKAHIVIHDIGGTYGLAFASLHPDRLASITILNSNFFPDFRWHFWARVWRTPVLGEFVMITGFRSLFIGELRKGSPGMPREYAVHAWERFGMKNRFQALAWYRAMDSKVLIGWDEKMLAATAKVPTRVLWGDRDPYIPVTTADRFGVSARHFPDAGHWLMLEKPNEVSEEIRELIRQTS